MIKLARNGLAEKESFESEDGQVKRDYFNNKNVFCKKKNILNLLTVWGPTYLFQKQKN